MLAEPGDWSWRAPQPPIEGRLLLSVSDAGFVKYLGYVDTQAGARASTVEEVIGVDPNSTPASQTFVIDAWLNETEPPGTFISIDCVMPPPGNTIPGLPTRYCQPTDFLTNDRHESDSADLGRATSKLSVQRQAGGEFGHGDNPSHGLFAVSPRLYGGCFGDSPCWEWDIVARLTDVATTQPTPSVASGVACGLPESWSMAGSSSPPTVVDATGLVASCEVIEAEASNDHGLEVMKPEGDETVLEVHWDGTPCDMGSTFRLSQSGSGFDLQGSRPDVGCDEPLVHHAMQIHLRQPITADMVTVELLAPGVPFATPTPISANVIECSDSPTDTRWPAHSTIHDETGLIESCETVDSSVTSDSVEVENPQGDLRVIRVSWLGGACDDPLEFKFARTTDGYSFGIVADDSSRGPCIAIAIGVARAIQLRLSDDVNANEISTFWTTPPPLEPGARTLECPYLDQPERTTEISIVDHDGVVAKCEAVLENATPPSELSGENPDGVLTHLDVDWRIHATCSSNPARLELWGPHVSEGITEDFQSDFDLWIDRLDPAARPQACLDAIATQGLRLELLQPIAEDQLNAFLAHDGRSGDEIDTPAGTFLLDLSAGGAEHLANEPIAVEASLLYLGSEPSVTLEGASEFIRFSIEDLNGWFGTSPTSGLMCGRLELTSGEAHIRDFYKIGGYSNSDPHVGFYRSYFDDPELRLPPGTYRISAGLGFKIGYGTCYDREGGFGLGTSIVIHVR